MYKILTSALAAVALTAVHSHAIIVEFTNPPYAAGTNQLGGQDNWSNVFGGFDAFTVNTTTETFDFNYVTTGAVQRTFTAAEVGGPFVPGVSTVTYAFEVDTIAPGGFTNGINFAIGGVNGSGSDLTVKFRGDGVLQLNDGIASGNDRFLGGTTDIANGTVVTVAIDYANLTYTASRSDLGISDTRPFALGNNDPYLLRIDGQGVLPISFSSITVVPEPTSAALLLGAAGLLALRRRRA